MKIKIDLPRTPTTQKIPEEHFQELSREISAIASQNRSITQQKRTELLAGLGHFLMQDHEHDDRIKDLLRLLSPPFPPEDSLPHPRNRWKHRV